MRRARGKDYLSSPLKGFLGVAFFLGVIAAFVLLASNPSPQNQSPFTWPRPQLTFLGTEVSLQVAQQKVSFVIRIPTFFPRAVSDLSVRIGAYPTGWFVYLLYSPAPISANVTEDQLFAAGGFFVIEVSEPNTDPTSVINANVQQNGALPLTINGNPGLYLGDQVHWWVDSIHCAIVSPYSSTDMIAMAEST